MLVSVVIPCYNSQASIRQVVQLTSQAFDAIEGYECEFVLVDDCSPDGTYREIERLAAERDDVLGLTLMRNFGQHSALMCGLNHARGDFCLGMDDDLQTHPSQIARLIAKMEEGYDVVYGVYGELRNGAIKNFTSWLNRVSAQILLDRPKDVETSNFWLITRQVRDEAIRYRNYNPYVEALFGRITNRVGNVTIEHHEREHGSSNYTLGKLVRLWLAYFNYTVLPLRVVSAVGVVSALVGFVFGIITFIRKLVTPNMAAGWASLVCIMLFFFGLVLLTLGIIGEYIADIVLPLNGTPQYLVRETTGTKDGREPHGMQDSAGRGEAS